MLPSLRGKDVESLIGVQSESSTVLFDPLYDSFHGCLISCGRGLDGRVSVSGPGVETVGSGECVEWSNCGRGAVSESICRESPSIRCPESIYGRPQRSSRRQTKQLQKRERRRLLTSFMASKGGRASTEPRSFTFLTLPFPLVFVDNPVNLFNKTFPKRGSSSGRTT